jgi:hypothetical protein
MIIVTVIYDTITETDPRITTLSGHIVRKIH